MRKTRFIWSPIGAGIAMLLMAFPLCAIADDSPLIVSLPDDSFVKEGPSPFFESDFSPQIDDVRAETPTPDTVNCDDGYVLQPAAWDFTELEDCDGDPSCGSSGSLSDFPHLLKYSCTAAFSGGDEAWGDPVYPAHETICDNGSDDDHDGSIDCADADCSGDPKCGGESSFWDDTAGEMNDGYVDSEEAPANDPWSLSNTGCGSAICVDTSISTSTSTGICQLFTDTSTDSSTSTVTATSNATSNATSTVTATATSTATSTVTATATSTATATGTPTWTATSTVVF